MIPQRLWSTVQYDTSEPSFTKEPFLFVALTSGSLLMYPYVYEYRDVPRLQSYSIYISQLVRFAKCCTSVLDFHSKNLQITSKLLTQGYRYHKLRKAFGKFFRSYSGLLSKFGNISFQEYLSKGISHPVFYGDLVYKLRKVKDTPNFFSSGSKIVKRLWRRQYYPVIIKRTIGLVLGPSTALYEPFLKHCTLTNKAVGTIWQALSKPPQSRQGPDLCPLWLLVGTPSAIIPELAFSRAEHSPSYSDVAKYIFDIYYLLTMLFVYLFLWPLRLVWLLVCCLYKGVYLQIFKCVSLWLHGCCGEWEGWSVNQINHTSWVAVVTPTDRPKSVRNCCLIEPFCGVVGVSLCPFDISVGVGAFVIGLGQISSFLSLSNTSDAEKSVRLSNCM